MKTANGSQFIRKICFHHCFLRSLLSSGGCGMLPHLLLCWKTGKLPVLGETAVASVPAATWGEPLLSAGF